MNQTEGRARFGAYETWYRITGDLNTGKTPIFLLHGGPGAAHNYLDSYKLLANDGRPVIHYDQIGCGNSTHLPEKGGDYWTPQLFVDELENLIDHLGQRAGFHVLGQSWGGMLGAEYGLRRPKGLKSLVIANSPASMALWTSEAMRQRSLMPQDIQDALNTCEASGDYDNPSYKAATDWVYARHVCRVVPNPPEVVASFTQLAADPTVYHTMNGPNEFFVVGTLKNWDITPELHKINVPTLLISGRHDEATPATVQPYKDLIKGASWMIFEDSSHMPHVEETAFCMGVVGGFLNAQDRTQHINPEKHMKKLLFATAAAALLGITPALAEYKSEHRGGTMRLVARSAGGTVDPHINYTLQYWQLYQSLYDGLVAFKKAAGAEGFNKVPDLAEAIPVPTNDGKTYVFKLRPGIKFSNGQDLTVKDVVASFQRIFKVSSPTAGGFYSVIVGADKCLAEPATCTLAGGVVADEGLGTITINLTRPDAEFFDKLALPHAAILPADTPAQDVGSSPIPGTGAYFISAYDPNKGMTIERNPNFKVWSEEAQPDGYPDVVQYDFGLTDEAEVTAVMNGEADWMFDQPPTDRLGEIGTTYKDQVYLNTLTAWWYAPMNTNIAPFNNEKARQAVNFALDRNALVNLFGGPVLASPICQVLPPGFPGHVPYCPYTKDPGEKWSAPDLDKARALVEESGTKGQKVTIIAEDNAVSKAIGTYMQSVLTDIGYDADVKPISSNIQFTYIQNTNNNVQISITQWYQDYPAASDFLNILFGCASFSPGSDSSINIAGFCDKDIQAKMDAALLQGVTDPEGANKVWAEVDRAVTDKAPMAALFTPRHIDFVSKRLGNFQFNNQFYWMVTQSWVQ